MRSKYSSLPALALALTLSNAFGSVSPVCAAGGSHAINSMNIRHKLVKSVISRAASIVAANMQPKPAEASRVPFAGKRVLWLGDSITQNGAYVTDVEYTLERRFPKEKFDIVSIGLASETVSGLSEKDHPFPRPWAHERLQRALDKVKPQVVVACYGMNDGIYHPQSPERMRAFQDGIGKLITAVKAAGAKLILLTPPPFDPLPLHSTLPADAPDFSFMKPYAAYDDVLSDYAKWEQTINEPGVTVVNIHTPLKAYLLHRRRTDPNFSYSSDGIHPDAIGHLLMSQAILQALGLDVPQGDPDAQVKALATDPLYKLVSDHRQTRSDGWLAYVGYTRGDTVHAASVDEAETKAGDLQKQIDDLRHAVRVACVGDSITWGAGTTDAGKYSYPVVLRGWLGPAYDTSNFGCSGATMLKRGDFSYWNQKEFKAAQEDKADVVVIALGTNDSKHPTPAMTNAPDNWRYKADYVHDYEDMIAIFREINPAVKVYVCTPPPAYPGNWGINDTTIREDIAPMVRQVAKDTGATVIDLYTALSGKSQLFPDTVHPNNEGAALIAATVYHSLTGKDAPVALASK